MRVPPGIAAFTPQEVADAAKKMADASGEVVVKSQILAGGRGLGTFKNGLKGGVHITKVRAESERKDSLQGQIRRSLGRRRRRPSPLPSGCLVRCW